MNNSNFMKIYLTLCFVLYVYVCIRVGESVFYYEQWDHLETNFTPRYEK